VAGREGELMRRTGHMLIARSLLFASASFSAGVAPAQTADVPYVPTPAIVVDAMLNLAKVGPRDYVVDLGSGDGRIIIAAAKKYGARGFGVDIDSALVGEAQREAQRQGVSDRVNFYTRNIYITDFSQATVITMYLFPQVNMRLRPRFFAELKPGTRIVSHEFDMDEWKPDERITLKVPDKPYGAPSSDVLLWIVPANAAGRWRWTSETHKQYDEVVLEQNFQMLQGKGYIAGRTGSVTQGRVNGEQLRFAFRSEGPSGTVEHDFQGRLSGDTLRGEWTTRAQKTVRRDWQATRSTRGSININAHAPSAQHTALAEERK
jgi:SAM-dependent methyltransferase